MSKKLLATLVSLAVLAPLAPTPSKAETATFSDVGSSALNAEAITWMKEGDIVQGYADGSFRPGNRINRAEFSKVVVESQGVEPKGANCFSDVHEEWFAKYVCTAEKLGYLKGYPDGSFRPGEYINFAEASKIIASVLKVKTDTAGTQGEWFAGPVNGLAKINAIPATVQFFDKDLSRGEMAEVVWRVETDKTDKVSPTYQDLTDPLPTMKDCVELEERVNEATARGGNFFIDAERGDFENAPLPPSSPEPSKMEDRDVSNQAPQGASDYSQTNVQVAGVDEADVVKSDGRYIYLIKQGGLRIVEAYPATALREVSAVRFEEQGFQAQEMFVAGDRLVVLGQVYKNPGPVPPIYYENDERLAPMTMPTMLKSQTKVAVLDIKDRTNPKTVRELTLDGGYLTSRRLGEQLVLVLNQYPNYYWGIYRQAGQPAQQGDLLPKISEGADAKETDLVPCSKVRYFPGYTTANFLIVASIPFTKDAATGPVKSEVILGASQNVYSSANNLYVANADMGYQVWGDWDWNRDRTETRIFRFSLKDGGLVFEARGSVPGTVLNQYAMDEDGQNFRVATTIDSWNSEKPSGNNVYVLDQALNIKGKLEDVAPGERIYSTRFMGDRLYMVTFRQVDPFFAIGLEGAKDPVILGSLKLPGFSNYLHPYDDTHILGFGADTYQTKEGGVRQGGFKMALFDVSNVSSPVEQFSKVVGEPGTYSELTQNPKALLFDKAKRLLAFPIATTKKVGEYEQYATDFVGAAVYSFDLQNGFKERGRITHYSAEDVAKMGNYWPYDYEKNIQRILYMDDVLYTVSNGLVKASDINSVQELKVAKID